jgi:DNA-binding transcriptional ArsR family regulator
LTPGASGAAGAGWVVGSSIAAELDLALTATGGYFMGQDLAPDIAAFLSAVPDDWLVDWQRFLGGRRRMVSLLGHAAFLAGVVAERDYSTATLAMREMDSQTALRALDQAFPRWEAGSSGSGDRAPGAELVERMMELLAVSYAEVGFPGFSEQPVGRQERDQLERMVRILRDGDLHARFWHWIDRLFYQHYLSLRSAWAEQMDEVEREVVAALGSIESDMGIPEIGWLSPLNPLNHHAPLAEAVRNRRLRVFFWVEPVGIPDLWALWPGLVMVSASRSEALLDNFRKFAIDVAARVRAIGDPTRLAILRVIRNMGIPNSSIAGYLGLAQPTVSVHARILRDAGFIRSRREGRVVRHEIVPGELERLFRDLHRLFGPASECEPAVAPGDGPDGESRAQG